MANRFIIWPRSFQSDYFPFNWECIGRKDLVKSIWFGYYFGKDYANASSIPVNTVDIEVVEDAESYLVFRWACILGNLLYNRQHCQRSDQRTSLFLCWRSTAERLCTFFYRIYPKENIVYSSVLQIFHMKNRWDIENFAFDAWWYEIKSYQNKYGMLLWDKNLRNREFGHNACSVRSRFSLEGSSFFLNQIFIYIHENFKFQCNPFSNKKDVSQGSSCRQNWHILFLDIFQWKLAQP
jgi:hypothetical protein